ncbi:hypothetical protein, partial [Oceanithermus profundus]
TVSGSTAYRVYRSGYTDNLGWIGVVTPDNFDADRDAIAPVAKMAANGSLVLSWVENTASGKVIYVKNTGTDSFYGSPPEIFESTGDFIPSLDMALDADDRPVIAWREQSNSLGIFAKYWDGSAWRSYGSSDLVNAGGFQVALELDPQGRPVIATNVRGHLIVMHWNGTAWDSYADEVNLDFGQELYSFDLAVNAGGHPVVVWSEDDGSGGYVLHAKLHNGLAQ